MSKPTKLEQISIVLATWCPHCVPLSLEMAGKMATELGVKYRVIDIDKDIETADRLVQEHGDYCEDYLIPQVFAEFSDGSVEHLFTGFSEDTNLTRKHWGDFFQSYHYQELKKREAMS